MDAENLFFGGLVFGGSVLSSSSSLHPVLCVCVSVCPCLFVYVFVSMSVCSCFVSYAGWQLLTGLIVAVEFVLG